MSPARAQTQTAWSGDEHTNHEATAPPMHLVITTNTNKKFDKDTLKDLQVNITFTCECTPEVLRDPLGVAEFGDEPMDSVRGGLDFEYVRSDNDAGCLSTQGDGDVTLLFSEDWRTLGLWPGNWTVSSHAVFSWAWFVDSFMTSPLTARSIQEMNYLAEVTPENP